MSTAYLLAVELARQENNQLSAAENAIRAIETSENHDDSIRLLTAYLVMASIKLSQTSYESALSYINKADSLLNNTAAFRSITRAKSLRNRVLMKMNSNAEYEVEKPEEDWLSNACAFPSNKPLILIT